MLITKPQDHGPFGFGKEDFKGFLPYMGMAAVLVMWRRCGKQTYPSPPPSNYWGAMWNLALIGLVISEEKMVEEFPYESLKNKWLLGRGHFLPQSYNFNNLRRCP